MGIAACSLPMSLPKVASDLPHGQASRDVQGELGMPAGARGLQQLGTTRVSGWGQCSSNSLVCGIVFFADVKPFCPCLFRVGRVPISRQVKQSRLPGEP